MPISHQKNIYSITTLVETLYNQEGVSTILDIGVGFGKYGALLRERLDIRLLRYDKEDWQVTIDGIEPYSNYLTPIHSYIYNTIYIAKIELILNNLPNYDVILMIDCLEHLEKEVGKKIVKALWDKTNKLIIFSFPKTDTPKPHTPWDNKLEIHRCVWSEKEISSLIGPVKHYPSTVCAKYKDNSHA